MGTSFCAKNVLKYLPPELPWLKPLLTVIHSYPDLTGIAKDKLT